MLAPLSFRSETRLTRYVRILDDVERRFPALIALLMFNGMVIFYSGIVVFLIIMGIIISGGETTLSVAVPKNSARVLDCCFAVFYLLKEAQAGLGSATRPSFALALFKASASFLSFSL